MQLEKIDLHGLANIYAISTVKKEFRKAVDEPWKEEPPWMRYQRTLLQDLAVLDIEKEGAVQLAHFEKLSGVEDLYSIHRPESTKNVRVLYTIIEDNVILLTAFLEKNDGDYQRAIKIAQNRRKWVDAD